MWLAGNVLNADIMSGEVAPAIKNEREFGKKIGSSPLVSNLCEALHIFEQWFA